MLLRTLLVTAVFAVSTTALADKPDFSLKDLDGQERRLSEFRGSWVVVNYWATWCRPCIDEMPELTEFHTTYEPAGATVLGINVEEIDVEQVREFVDSLSVTYPVLLAGPSPPEGMPTVIGLPTTVVVSPNGDVVSIELGLVTKDSLEETITQNGGDLQ